MLEFSAINAVAALAGVVAGVEHEIHKGLEKAAKLVEAEAKGEIGTYQAAAGPFAAWAELADYTKDDRVKSGYSENDPLLRDGTLRDSIGIKVSGHEAAIGSDLAVAEYQELGTRSIPPRSFLGSAAVRKTPDIVEIVGESVAIGLAGEGVFRKFLSVR